MRVDMNWQETGTDKTVLVLMFVGKTAQRNAALCQQLRSSAVCTRCKRSRGSYWVSLPRPSSAGVGRRMHHMESGECLHHSHSLCLPHKMSTRSWHRRRVAFSACLLLAWESVFSIGFSRY